MLLYEQIASFKRRARIHLELAPFFREADINIEMAKKNEGDSFPERLWNDLNVKRQKNQTTKFTSANLQRMLSPRYIILRMQKLLVRQSRSV